jgi:hypothetical protein
MSAGPYFYGLDGQPSLGGGGWSWAKKRIAIDLVL